MAMPTVADHHLEMAKASYARCQLAPDFFRAFYNRFLMSDPTIPPYFVATSFNKQHKLLQHGISLLLIYASRPNPTLLSRIAERHGQSDLNVPHRLYPAFVTSFLDTVKEFDPSYDADLAAAWKAALEPGIAFMQGR
jgi:hemoglobin-like flavoprotein